MARAAPITACALVLSLAGCAAASGTEPLGVAREADGPRPLVGFPTDVAPAESAPVPIDSVSFASRGHDYIAVWPTSPVEGETVIDGIRFGEDGAPASKAPVHVASFDNFPEAMITDVACAPDGDCMVVVSAENAFPGGAQAATWRADGSKVSVSLPVEPGLFSFPWLAYDSDSASFLVAWQAPGIQAVHFADGVPIESAPLEISAVDGLGGVACAPGNGCLVLFTDDATSTSGVIVTSEGVGAQLAIADRLLQLPTYGDGVYFTIAPTNFKSGVVRIGLDGALLDAAPIPAGDLPQKLELLNGVGFDGSSFVVLQTAFDELHGKNINVAQTAWRVRADGTSPTPATIQLGGLAVERAFACGDGTCEIALGADTKHRPALSTAALHDTTVTPSASDLVTAPASQEGGATLSLGAKVLVAWSEGATLRSRSFDGSGRAAGPPRDLDEPRRLLAFDDHDDAALLVLAGANLERVTRVVASDGTIGPAVPFHPPAHTSHEHARFGVLQDPAGGDVLRLLRFDAKGRALDADPIVVPRPIDAAVGAAIGRAGDTFVIVFQDPAPGIISEVARIRDTGEVIDINQVQPNASILSSPRGVACSPSECAIVWSGTSSFGGSNAPEAWIARFPPGASPLTIKPEFLARGDPRGVVFDGQSFLAAFTRGNDLGVARADADGPRVGTGMINGDEFLAMAAVDGGALILTANTVDLGLLQPSAARLHVRNVLDEGGTEPGSSGAGGAGGGETTGEIVAGGGCGCELDARNDVGGWAIAVWCTLIAAGKRRRSKTRPRS